MARVNPGPVLICVRWQVTLVIPYGSLQVMLRTHEELYTSLNFIMFQKLSVAKILAVRAAKIISESLYAVRFTNSLLNHKRLLH